MKRSCATLLPCLALGAMSGATALAQAAAKTQGPPLPRATDQPNTWLIIAVVVVLVGAAIVVSIMPAKRGHMD